MFRRKKNTLPQSSHSVIQPKKSFDMSLLVSVIILSIFGLVMVYDSSVAQAYKDYGDKYLYVRQQSIWMILGFGLLAFFSFFNHQFLKRWALPLWIISFVLLLAVFIPGLGISAGGAHRWIRIGVFSLQPAEIIKLTTVIFLAFLFEKQKLATSNIKNFQSTLYPFLIIILLVSFVIAVLQRDLGTTIVFFLICLTMFIAAGGPMRYVLAFIPISLLGFLAFVLSSSYRKHRMLAFLDPFADPQGYSYHISQILLALGSGGIFGLGVGQSRQKYEYIPEVTTDSIFAIIGEEFGFIGCLILISLISFFIFRGFKIAENAKDEFSRLLAFGIVAWLGCQAIINLAAMVSLVPLTGVPLPFISYGGSALLINLMAVGILLNISKQTNQ